MTASETGQLPTRMRAAVYHGRRDVRIEEVDVPSPGPDEVLLRVATVGVCGTDAAEWSQGATQYPIQHRHPVTRHKGPLVIGHEFSGHVVEIGAEVDAAWRGSLVASCGAGPCGSCARCQSGRSNLCTRYSAVGLHRHGALAEYVAAPVGSCLRADDAGLTPDEAALGQPMAIAVHVSKRSGVRAHDRVVVLGAGGIGAFLVHALVQQQVEVVAVDLDETRLALARELGAWHTVRAEPTNDDSTIRSALRGEPDAVFEVTGSPVGLEVALGLVPSGGRLILVGVQKRPVEVLLTSVTLREQEIIGTNAMVRESDFPTALELLQRRRGRWDLLAPVVLPLHEVVSGALEPMAAGRPPAIKTLIDPSGGERRPLYTVSPSHTASS